MPIFLYRRKFFIYALFLISCKNEKSEALKFSKFAKTNFENGNYQKADSFCNLAISADSMNVNFYILKSRIRNRQENYRDAIVILKNLLKRGNRLDTVFYLIAKNYFALTSENEMKNSNTSHNDFDNTYSALSFFDSTINANPYYYLAYLEKSKMLHNSEEYEKSMLVLNRAIVLFPDSMELILWRGIEKVHLGDKFGATIDLNKALATKKLDSVNVADACRFKSHIFLEDKKYDSALKILATGIMYNPFDYYLYATRGDLYILMNKKDSACQDYRKAADLGLVSVYNEIKEYCEK